MFGHDILVSESTRLRKNGPKKKLTPSSFRYICSGVNGTLNLRLLLNALLACRAAVEV
jgi:hypothetical protein